MTENKKSEDLETKIIEAAKELFIENGFAETSMSDIATKVGINRPGVHYYFRTKDKMFQAVFGSIVKSLIPKVQDIILQQDTPIGERIGRVVDAYYEVFKANPNLPIFIVKEMHRDFDYFSKTITEMHSVHYFDTIRNGLQNEMKKGKLKTVPMRFLFLTFYSLLTMPFSTKNMCQNILLEENETYDEMLAKWKPYIITHVCNLLSNENQN